MIDGRIDLQDAAVKAALERLRLAMHGQLWKPMREIGRTLKTSTQLRFREQVSPAGVPWKKSRRALAVSGQTLRKTGRLRNSITYAADDEGVVVGTNVVHAAAHQFGRSGTEQVKAHSRKVTQVYGHRLSMPVVAQVRSFQRKLNLVARPFLGVSSQDRKDIVAILRAHLFRAAGVELPDI